MLDETPLKPEKPPLGLPTGSVRAVLAVMLIGTLCGLCLMGRTGPGELWAMAGVVVTMYFGARNGGEK